MKKVSYKMRWNSEYNNWNNDSFLGTVLGASCVYLLKDKLNNRLEKFLLGFASGVMIAASIWSLLIPAIDLAKESMQISWLPASIGFLLGVAFYLY